MFPIRDNNTTRGTAYVTILLIIVNSGVFLFQMSARNTAVDSLRYGFMPAQLLAKPGQFEQGLAQFYRIPMTNSRGEPYVNLLTRQYVMTTDQAAINEIQRYPAWAKLFTCMFLHGGWMHLIGNMLFLWIFGNYIEDRLGPLLFFVFYITTGVCAGVAHGFLDTWFSGAALSGYVPLVGASGAISGVMGAYLVLAPKSRIQAITLLGYVPITINLPAWVYMAFFIIIQNLYPATFSVGKGGVAHWAHLGGIVSGVLLILLLPKRIALPARVYSEKEDPADIVI